MFVEVVVRVTTFARACPSPEIPRHAGSAEVEFPGLLGQSCAPPEADSAWVAVETNWVRMTVPITRGDDGHLVVDTHRHRTDSSWSRWPAAGHGQNDATSSGGRQGAYKRRGPSRPPVTAAAAVALASWTSDAPQGDRVVGLVPAVQLGAADPKTPGAFAGFTVSGPTGQGQAGSYLRSNRPRPRGQLADELDRAIPALSA